MYHSRPNRPKLTFFISEFSNYSAIVAALVSNPKHASYFYGTQLVSNLGFLISKPSHPHTDIIT